VIYCRASIVRIKYYCHRHDGSAEKAKSDQQIWILKYVENDSFKNMFEIANMSQMLNVLYLEMNSHNDMCSKKHQLKLNPSKFQKVKTYFILFLCNCY